MFACAFFTFWMPAYAWAQPPDSGAAPENIAADPPAHVSFVDGSAVLERDGQPDAAPANMPLLAGDRIRTQAGRVEILFADGSTLHLDANTTVDFQSDELVRLLDGRIRLAIPGPDRRVSYRIDAPSASAVILQPGEYKLSVLHSTRDGEIELAVLRGAAELVNDDGRTPLRAGERAYARANAAPSYAYAFNSAAWDSFDRWSETRRDQRLGVSAQYLPDEVRPYAASFDQYGSWQYQPTYGYVWYPRVSVDWRPYYRGRWVTLRPYGWTWVGLDPFAWPTHHFGRWGFSAGAWFWIPARTWAPAWVSWAYAPGYVSWCPLGWNNRPVIQINVFNRGYDPWRAWTVIPRRHFGVDYVNVHYVAGDRFDARVWRTFEPRYRAPETSGYAVPRSSAPIRVAGTVSPRRSPSTVYTNLEPGASRVPSGGQRVIVGQPRGSVAPVPAPQDVSRRSPAGGPADLSRRSPAGGPADLSRRSAGGAE
ncbi:MAG TPA: FecR family protein, partial [Thermoanaerobaculia bacterium]|nr:FecR family protein [Thermoanaerobaculia bacterium]